MNENSPYKTINNITNIVAIVSASADNLLANRIIKIIKMLVHNDISQCIQNVIRGIYRCVAFLITPHLAVQLIYEVLAINN